MRKMIDNFLLRLVVVLVAVVLGFSGNGLAGESAPPENLLENPGFEYGVAGWRLDKAGETQATFKVDRVEAAHGKSSALVTIGKAEQWGTQFGQNVEAPVRGKTYTFSAMAKSTAAPVAVRLEIEAPAPPGIERPQPSRSR